MCETGSQRDIGCIKPVHAFGEGYGHVETAGLCASGPCEGDCWGGRKVAPSDIVKYPAHNLARVMNGFRAAEPRCHQRVRIAGGIGGFVKVTVTGTQVPGIRRVKFRPSAAVVCNALCARPVEVAAS